MVSLHPFACIFWAFLLLTLPLKWLLAAFAAAAFHEACHCCAILLVGGKVHKIRLGITGAEMVTSPLSDRQELLCALAGPMGSFLLLGLSRHAPLVSLCGFIQGIFNLLPLFPLDGGRAAGCALRLLFPGKGHRLADLMSFAAFCTLLLLTAAAAWRLKWEIIPLTAAVLLIPKGSLRKRPCKLGKIRVQ